VGVRSVGCAAHRGVRTDFVPEIELRGDDLAASGADVAGRLGSEDFGDLQAEAAGAFRREGCAGASRFVGAGVLDWEVGRGAVSEQVGADGAGGVLKAVGGQFGQGEDHVVACGLGQAPCGEVGGDDASQRGEQVGASRGQRTVNEGLGDLGIQWSKIGGVGHALAAMRDG